MISQRLDEALISAGVVREAIITRLPYQSEQEEVYSDQVQFAHPNLTLQASIRAEVSHY